MSSSPRSSGTPVANPYGSYVSAPSAYQGSSYPDATAAGPAPADRQAYPSAAQAPGPSSYYPAAADGYLPAAGPDAPVPAKGRHAHNASVPRGYAEIDYSSLRYDDPAYPDGASGAPAGQYEQNGYGGSDYGYGQDDYQGYSGYGARGR